MNTGERIKRIRVKRGMTQKELGIAVGFPERSADVRIAQYESGTRKPKEDLVNALARVLNVSPHAIADTDYDTPIGLMYTLFDLEDTYGIHIDQIDGELCLRMNCIHKEYVSVFDMMLEWYEAWKKDQEDESNLDGYLEWKLGYPHPINKK